MKLFLILAVVTLAFSKSVTFSATPTHIQGRAHLSHSKVMLEEWRHQQMPSLRRHDLSEYYAVPLQTNHFAFTLNLKVHGLNYKMSMDTGSSDIFIKGENAPGVPKRRYRSKTNYRRRRPQVQIGYLDGQMQTYATVLDAEFQGQKFDLPLLVAYTAPPQFEDVQGLIGLSYPELARHKPTFIQTLIKNNLISEYAYGMNLNLIQHNRSFVTFGERDQNLFEGDMIQYPLQKQKEIKIDFDWIKIGDSGELKISQALLDTGNTCISIPYKYEQDILSAFKTSNNHCAFQVEENVPMFSILLCKVRNFDELPALVMNIKGNQYIIQKEFYLQDCVQNPDEPEQDVYYCQTYIQTTKYSRNDMIFLGDGFFNRFYTYFDLENEKVGIAKNRENITLADIIKQDGEYTPEDWKLVNEDYNEE